jgi:hypothetical protein
VISGLSLLLMTALAGYAGATRFRAHRRDSGSVARLGRQLPSLWVVDAWGNRVDLSKAAVGRRSVIAFYSASCRACQVVLPGLYPFPPELSLFLVSEGGDPRDDSAGSTRAPALLFHDREGVFARSFPMSPLPTIVFVDERGIVRAGLAGERTRDKVQAGLKKFVEEP